MVVISVPKLPLVSDHAWGRWKERFPGMSMIGALQSAKPVNDVVRLAHFIEQRPGFAVIGHGPAIFIIKKRVNMVVTVIRRKKISQAMCQMIQAGHIP